MKIFQPVFGPRQNWETFSERLYLHNVLRANMDIEAIEALPADTADILTNIDLDQWLPFVEDYHLDEWRQYLVRQLQPGSSVKTVDVFAARHGSDPGEFRAVVGSESYLEEKIFTRIPRESLTEFRQQVIELNIKLLDDYL
jgi:hypothetical protein